MISRIESTLLRRLTIEDLPEALALQDRVAPGVRKEFIRCKREDEMQAYLNGGSGAAYGVFDEGALAAISFLRIPNENTPNDDRGVPFPRIPREDWPFHAGFLEHALVVPHARGRGYQRSLFQARSTHAAETKLRWLFAGAHLENSISWGNLIAVGMVLVGVRMDPVHPRVGLLKSLTASELVYDREDQVLVPAHDYEAHQAVLQKGYVGVRLDPSGTTIYHRLLQGSET